MEKYPTVTIACPVRNRELYLPYYLDNILKQTYPKEFTNLFFVINNCSDTSPQILKEFKKLHKDKYANIRIDTLNNDKIPDDSKDRLIRAKTNLIYDFLSELRNYICKNTNSDFLFSVDSDIMLLPKTLEKLVTSGKDCISALVCNGHIFGEIYKVDKYKYTNALKLNAKGTYVHLRKSELKGIVEVDITGAVYLLAKDIYKNCRYRKHLQGEDIPFCQDIKKLGYKLYCDADLKLAHLMTPKLLQEYLDGNFTY